MRTVKPGAEISFLYLPGERSSLEMTYHGVFRHPVGGPSDTEPRLLYPAGTTVKSNSQTAPLLEAYKHVQH